MQRLSGWMFPLAHFRCRAAFSLCPSVTSSLEIFLSDSEAAIKGKDSRFPLTTHTEWAIITDFCSFSWVISISFLLNLCIFFFYKFFLKVQRLIYSVHLCCLLVSDTHLHHQIVFFATERSAGVFTEAGGSSYEYISLRGVKQTAALTFEERQRW